MSVRPRPRAALRVWLTALLCALLALLAGCSAQSGTPSSGGGPTPAWAEGMATVREERLPAEARDTLRLIDRGGPYPYAKDGSVFGNYERLLPERERGHYREYTVPTPGSRDRGARRLVTGREDEIYWTEDHYASFRAVLR
ncbi:ribonuclease domain-containing protein [Streptomyces sp. BBFR102]|uniref:ribonuclease domain-containing protein n=1 Tax=Streptomyces sp. BBFR102 TaxID=3448171 RepID=UPI003F53432E